MTCLQHQSRNCRAVVPTMCKPIKSYTNKTMNNAYL
uniref:Uncharacterized protein n=1 Tax=Arundo donax TaxID=35708 RepID=A0A0A9A3W8_ARUDO